MVGKGQYAGLAGHFARALGALDHLRFGGRRLGRGLGYFGLFFGFGFRLGFGHVFFGRRGFLGHFFQRRGFFAQQLHVARSAVLVTAAALEAGDIQQRYDQREQQHRQAQGHDRAPEAPVGFLVEQPDVLAYGINAQASGSVLGNSCSTASEIRA